MNSSPKACNSEQRSNIVYMLMDCVTLKRGYMCVLGCVCVCENSFPTNCFSAWNSPQLLFLPLREAVQVYIFILYIHLESHGENSCGCMILSSSPVCKERDNCPWIHNQHWLNMNPALDLKQKVHLTPVPCSFIVTGTQRWILEIKAFYLLWNLQPKTTS